MWPNTILEADMPCLVHLKVSFVEPINPEEETKGDRMTVGDDDDDGDSEPQDALITTRRQGSKPST